MAKTIKLSENGAYWYVASMAVRKGFVFKSRSVTLIAQHLGLTIQELEKCYSVRWFKRSGDAHTALSKDLGDSK